MSKYINVGGTWKLVSGAYINVAGYWKRIVSGYINVAGYWKLFFEYQLTPAIASSAEISVNSSTFPTTLTGTNYHWTNATSLTYKFQVSTDDTTWTDIGSAVYIANPSIGASNTVTYITLQADYTQALMYFRFLVIAVNSYYSTTATSYSTSTAVGIAPLAPTNLSATKSGSSVINLSWTASGFSTTTYEIYWGGASSSTPNAGSTPDFYVSAPTTTYSNTGLSPVTTRYYWIRAVNIYGTSAWSTSNAVFATTDASVPSAPTIGTVTVTNNSTVSIPFTAPASNGGASITSYTTTSSPSISLSTSGTSTPLTVTGTFASGQAYTFTIVANNSAGSSASSSASNSVTPNVASRPGPPTLTSSSSTSSSITFAWSIGSDSSSLVKIDIGFSAAGGTDVVNGATTTSSSRTQSSLTSTHTYYVRITSYSTAYGYGDYLDFTVATTGTSPLQTSSPSLSGSGLYNTNLTFSGGSYTNTASLTTHLVFAVANSFTSSTPTKTSSSPYTITALDSDSPGNYFAVRDTVVGTNSITYYYYSSATHTSQDTMPVPTFSAATSAIGGFSFTITNYDAGNIYYISSVSNGSVTSAGGMYPTTSTITVTGLTSGQSSTVALVVDKTGFVDNTASITGTATVVITPGVPNIVSTSSTNSTITITWSSGGDTDNYRMIVGTSAGASNVRDLTTTSTSSTTTGLSQSFTYYVSIYGYWSATSTYGSPASTTIATTGSGTTAGTTAGTTTTATTTTTTTTTTTAAPSTVTVPSVVGTLEASAISAIQAQGLVASVSYDYGGNFSNDGTVKSQSPAGGTTVNVGSTVSIVVWIF